LSQDAYYIATQINKIYDGQKGLHVLSSVRRRGKRKNERFSLGILKH